MRRPRIIIIIATCFSLIDHGHLAFAAQGDYVMNSVDYMWSTPFWRVPIAPEDASDGILEPSKLAKLAQVALKGFRYYTEKIVPKQLEQDATFAAQYNAASDSGVNLGFLNWQKRIFSKKFGVSYQHLDWDGASPMKYNGIPMNWKEFFDGADYVSLRKSIAFVAKYYLRQFQSSERKLEVAVWAEVYPYNTMQLTHTHTGALCGGMIPAKLTVDGNDGQTIVIDDTRTAVDPFGRQHEISPQVGDLYMWPSWTPHMVTPQLKHDANVYFSFLVFDRDQTDIDWEDDPIGDYIFNKKANISRRSRSQQASSTSKTEL